MSNLRQDAGTEGDTALVPIVTVKFMFYYTIGLELKKFVVSIETYYPITSKAIIS